MIDQATRCGDDDIGAGFEFLSLFAKAHTTVKQGDLEAGVLAVFLK